MPRVVLIRSGCTDYDEQKRIQGSLDLPLNPRGRDQVQRIVAALEDVPLEIVYSAPCDPARSTAEAVANHFGIPWRETEDLQNLNHGLWQGLPVEELRRKYPKVFKQWQDSPETICPPEGETVSEALARVRKTLRKVFKRKALVAIVASEPLATLIANDLKGLRLETAPRVGGCGDELLVEIIETERRSEMNGSAEDHETIRSVAGVGAVNRGDAVHEFGPEA